ncbi:hypothetical protein [Coleofasciculus sp. F4-SAH-05]|uniref:hypothetical protein n=1 Tax=Coleofasciculus sp. F4-SAH-05 TaxID=3069525 RepID=UPI0032F7E0F6
MYERRRDLAALIPEASYISPPSVLVGTILPIHPGAQAYYDREKPSFLQENADWLGLLLSIAVVIWSWAWQLKSQLEQKQKNQGDNYNQEILVLMKHIECFDTPRPISAGILSSATHLTIIYPCGNT